MASSADPFRTLGIEPTLDRASIKRAYFGELQRHPPHADPEGFRRIRDAYEQLEGDALMTQWSVAKLDITHELELLDAELGPRIEAAKRACQARADERGAIAGFAAVLTLALDDAIERCE